jgi:hypothetical protein
LHIGITGLNPLPKTKQMRKNIINTHASKEAAILGPGSTLESVGVFFMNIYKPTPLPVAYCDEQISELELRKEYENYRRENKVLTLLQCEYLWMKLDLQIIYYNQCKKLTLKGQKQ